MMEVVYNGEIYTDFYEKPIIPIIYCHGLSANRTFQSSTCKDFASHGYIVFTMDHRDKSSSYIKDQDGKENYFNNENQVEDLQFRREQILIREKETLELINEMFTPDFLQKALNFPKQVKLNLDKLIAGGHSFGGMTGIAAARSDDRIKAVVTLDPWLFAYHKEVLAGDFYIKQPLVAANSEFFHQYCGF